jgi:hypothetical protein
VSTPPVRYWVLVSDDLINAQPTWPDVLRYIQAGPYEYPGMRWHMFKDDEAPADLDGKRVDLILTDVDGTPVISERRLAG